MTSGTTTVFAERRETLHLLRSAEGPVWERSRHRGVGLGHERAGRSDWRYQALPAPGNGTVRLPGSVADAVAPLAEPWPTAYDAESVLDDVATGVRAATADRWDTRVSLRSVDQHVVTGPAHAPVTDHRTFATANLLVSVPGPDGPVTVRRDSVCSAGTGLRELTAVLVDELGAAARETARLPVARLAAGRRPVVLAPGGCAMFFHEVCGHPLEGDVVESGTSYLVPLRGRRVGPEQLTVLDDPVSGSAALGYAVDDEGVPAQPVALVDGGVVGGPLHNRSTAAAAGVEPDGHGRRMSYLYPALPRQAHTRVLPGADDPSALCDGPEVVLVQRIRVRHVHQATGAFSLLVQEGRLLRGGEPVARLDGVLLEGTGVEALAGVAGVGTDPQVWAGGGGCGKLDQGPLIVGFEQPTVRVEGLCTTSTTT